MSVTAPPAQQAQAQQTHALVAAIVLILAADMTPALTLTVLSGLLAPIGISAAAIEQALTLLGPLPSEPAATAARFTRAAEFVYRAQYILAAATRLSHGGTLTAEQRYGRAHLHAQKARAGAAAAIDATVARHGPRLVWTAMMDSRTTPGCAAANGQVFDVGAPLVVEGRRGYPGQIHVTCRCVGLPA